MQADITTEVKDILSLFSNQAFASFAIVYGLNYLKKSKWFPLLSYETSKLNHAAMLVVSGLASVGIHLSYSRGTLTITGLSVATILAGVVHWVQSYLATRVTYDMLKSKLDPLPIVAASNYNPNVPPPAFLTGMTLSSVSTPKDPGK